MTKLAIINNAIWLNLCELVGMPDEERLEHEAQGEAWHAVLEPTWQGCTQVGERGVWWQHVNDSCMRFLAIAPYDPRDTIADWAGMFRKGSWPKTWISKKDCTLSKEQIAAARYKAARAALGKPELMQAQVGDWMAVALSKSAMAIGKVLSLKENGTPDHVMIHGRDDTTDDSELSIFEWERGSFIFDDKKGGTLEAVSHLWEARKTRFGPYPAIAGAVANKRRHLAAKADRKKGLSSYKAAAKRTRDEIKKKAGGTKIVVDKTDTGC